MSDLEKIAGSVAKLEKLGCDLGRVAELLGRLADFEGAKGLERSPAEGEIRCVA